MSGSFPVRSSSPLAKQRFRGRGRQARGFRTVHDLADPAANRVRVLLLRAFRRLRSRADRLAVGRALERRNVDELTLALGLDLSQESIAALNENLEEVRGALRGLVVAAGLAELERVPERARLSVRFDLNNPRARAFVERYEFELVVGVQDRMMRGFRAGLAEALEGTVAPFPLARDRIKPLIGLTERQASYVENFRRQLLERSNLGLTPVQRRRLRERDARLAVAHLETGRLAPARVDRLVGRYADSLLNLRAQTIARTETIRAATAGQRLVWEQAADEGLIDRDRVRRFWVHTPDERTRRTHRRIGPVLNPEGRSLQEFFETDFGPVYEPPAEPNCRCALEFREVET